MGLRDRYAGAASSSTPAAAPASAAPPAAPQSTPTSAAPPAEPSSSPADVSASSTSTPSARRDLVALRAQLSGGTNGGVNPPEAAAVADDLLDPCTRETPDGGAEPLPNHPDLAKAAAKATTQADAPAKRKRRTKAEMEAARAAAASTTSAAAGPRPAAQAAATEPSPDPQENEFRVELAAAAAETEGHVILTNTLRDQLARDTMRLYLRDLSLAGAIDLVRERMFKGMKTLEIER
jgi:hypothetical protein